MTRKDLTVDQIYPGGRAGNAGDDPFPDLLGLSNQGGFRYLGRKDAPGLLMLLTSMTDANWPDSLDRETGALTYYGDNKSAGRALHATPRFGNLILRNLFSNTGSARDRLALPPILVFARTGVYRDVVFLGLAVPGTPNGNPTEELTAVWRTQDGKRFQNYRARFTVLDVPTVTQSSLENWPDEAPVVWRSWAASGQPQALTATPNRRHRTRAEQLSTGRDFELVRTVYEYFRNAPHEFEHCAAQISKWTLRSVTELAVTRASRDGGRDAIGQLRIGSAESSITIDFAMEAKCYQPMNSVGVKELSRLISRLRNRQFGVLVTTSFLDNQAYRELVDDGHPVIVISNADIARILIEHDLSSIAAVSRWLQSSFPL